MGTDQASEVDLQFVSGEESMSGLRTAEPADQGDLGRDDGDGAEGDAKGFDLLIDDEDDFEDELAPDPEDWSEFVTVGTPDRIYSSVQEFIVTIVEVWDDPSEAYMPVMQLRTLDGLLIANMDSRNEDHAGVVTLVAEEVREDTQVMEID